MQAQPPVKTLTPAVAQAAFIEEFPLTYVVMDKFFDDHIIKGALSKKQAIEGAIERYTKNQKILKSSWVELTADALKNKAKGATRRIAGIHNGKQQMTVQVKVQRKTITMTELQYKELQRYEYEEVVISGAKKYINCSSAATGEVLLNVVGEWKPLKGEVQIYHYDEGTFPTTAAMLPEYLKWRMGPDGKPSAPVATK